MRALVCLTALAALLSIGSLQWPLSAQAAPSLQLPWPTGTQHRINGGYTYGCGTHGGPGYETNYYAIDFQFPIIGDSISATAAGTVVIASIGFNGGAGNYIAIDHGGGYVSRYLHLRESSPWPATIFVGAQISQGEPVAYSGDTGLVPPHLHFDLKLNGSAHKPEPMSGVTGFGWYGFSQESGLNCSPGPASPYWYSYAPGTPVEAQAARTPPAA